MGGNRRISSDLKECALRLWKLGWDRNLIIESLCISKSSLYRWRHIFEQYQSVQHPRSQILGRPRAILLGVLTAIQAVYNNEADIYLDELVWWLAVHHDLAISRSALQKMLVDAGLMWKLLHKIAQERDAEAQADFNADEFRDFIVEQVLPEVQPYPAARSILIMDNCRIHHNIELVDVVNAAGCLLIYLPAYSPDLNPIEESFSTLKAYLRRHVTQIRAEADPEMALIEACGCVTADKAKNWFRHAGLIWN